MHLTTLLIVAIVDVTLNNISLLTSYLVGCKYITYWQKHQHRLIPKAGFYSLYQPNTDGCPMFKLKLLEKL